MTVADGSTGGSAAGPTAGAADRTADAATGQAGPATVPTTSAATPSLTHVDATGAARMVDVSAKEPTSRTALATGALRTTPEVIALLRQNGLPKGDALATARIAGIMAAKRTPDLIPLCHPIAISGVSVELSLRRSDVRISATVRTTDRTGVEMEALTAVAVAGLTLHDMIKAVDPAAVLGEIRVERKDGGKTGLWVRPGGTLAAFGICAGDDTIRVKPFDLVLGEMTVVGSCAGVGPDWPDAMALIANGHIKPESMYSMIVPLEELESALKELRSNPDLIKVFVSADISKREILSK